MESFSDIIHYIGTNAGVLHLLNNLSDHCPIYCRLPVTDLKNTPNRSWLNSAPKPSQSSASNEQKQEYLVSLEKSLRQIEVPDGLKCCDNVRWKHIKLRMIS